MYLLILILLTVELTILFLAANLHTKKLFSFLPSMFWIYFTPMLLSTCGAIDAKSPVYAAITKYFLPPSLFLLLLNIDIKAISRLGPAALTMFFAGSLGIVMGMILSFMVFKPIVGGQFWAGFGALAASWTGGSANMVAVKEALNCPDPVFLPMVIVDTVLPYVWVGILVALAGKQKLFDGWNHSDRRILDDLGSRVIARATNGGAKTSPDLFKIAMMAALALVIGITCQKLSLHLPANKNILTPYGWTILLVTTLAIMGSLTPVKALVDAHTHKFGKWILYFVLTSIGARATLSHAAQAGILLAAGALVILVHVTILLLVGRLLKAPLFLIATSSLANMAGLVSAPMIAEVYQPGLASVGLLLAILGHSLGAYTGILTGQICRIFVG